mmetsp:Transcript_34508/g.68532  ORF Transcript_34508/g.68532 Transcript_34508/m.68532 type:complete len:204 (-) Transcript_34508:108-719(-)
MTSCQSEFARSATSIVLKGCPRTLGRWRSWLGKRSCSPSPLSDSSTTHSPSPFNRGSSHLCGEAAPVSDSSEEVVSDSLTPPWASSANRSEMNHPLWSSKRRRTPCANAPPIPPLPTRSCSGAKRSRRRGSSMSTMEKNVAAALVVVALPSATPLLPPRRVKDEDEDEEEAVGSREESLQTRMWLKSSTRERRRERRCSGPSL